MTATLRKLTMLICLPVIVLSCGRTSETDLPGPAEQGRKESVAADTSTAQFRANIFCNHHRYGPDSGSTATFSGTGGMTCEHADRAPSDIAWHFLGVRDGKDVYEVEIRVQVDDATSTTTKKEIEFEGVELTLLEVDYKRVTVVPAEPERSNPADNKAPAEP